MKEEIPLLAAIQKTLTTLPKESGVYRFFDDSGDLLYIGKAKDLRNRVRSYFQKGSAHASKTKKLISKIAKIEYTTTRNETEALLLEANLVHEHQPPYNVLLRDDKHFLYVKITKEPFPCVLFTRRRENDGATYFGPYAKAGDIRSTLDFLREILCFRNCKVEISPEGKTLANPENRKIPCLDYQIRRCTAPCDAHVSQEEYAKNIRELVSFLKGNTTNIGKYAKKEMEEAASRREFERAARFRDIRAIIERIEVKQVAILPEDTSADVIGVYFGVERTFFHILFLRNGKIIRSDNFSLRNGENNSETLFAFLRDHILLSSDIPELFLVPDCLSESDCALLESYTEEASGKKASFRVPQRGNKKEILELAHENASRNATLSRAAFEKDETLIRLQNALHLPTPPERIECYDISHLSGTHAVGSRVVFLDGKPAKSEYRKYKIRNLPSGQIDDFKAMAEVLGRRLKRLERGVPLLKVEEVTDTEKQKEIQGQIQKQGLPTDYAPESYFSFTEITTEKVVGYAQLRRFGKVVEAGGVLVFPEFREKGMGTEILKALVFHSSEKNIRAVIKTDQLRWKISLKALGFIEEKMVPKIFASVLAQRQEKDGKERIIMKISPDDLRKAAKKIPDLLVIDGGKGQLSAVVSVLRTMNLFRKIRVCALAKRNEEIFVPDSGDPLPIPKDAPESKLLQHIRDEAHRFAVSFNRQQRKASETTSILDEIPDLGSATRKKLLETFGSASAALNASEEELSKVLSPSALKSFLTFREK